MGAPSAMGQGPSTLTKTGHDTITTTTNKLSSSDQQPSDLEKDQDQDQAPAPNQEDHASTGSSGEVFHETAEGVNFRTVSWQRATVLFLKIQFAMSILAVPSSLGTLGAVGGALSIVGWQLLNTCRYCPYMHAHILLHTHIYIYKMRLLTECMNER